MRTNTMLRNTVLTAAGFAATAGGIAGPAIAAHATPAEKTAQVSTDRKGHGERELDVRYEAQPNFYYCGPAATRNAISVLGKNIDVDAMAKEMGTTENGTNSINDITPVLNKETGKHYRSVEIKDGKADDKQTDTLRTDIVRTVDDGRAVVANIAGTTTDTDGNTHSFEGGHYISVVGYRDGGKTVTIADSADPNMASYRISVDNLADWIATRGYSAS
ncbi:phytochelatin synthase [Micromonospora terminaliae]|uniref:C39 family peptidase n=2 Tax=Micromonospora terminaliae TaxID=1914461 RepID=A0A6I5UJY3_9ACTN|nr:C39 family peptidase [Micromonospora terminaliae]NES29140.1 C39 family peptidase [Micromonospora terminaliae]QGL48401.1 phytochelatin synthase [Micromonospora terminaliae]QGL48861.1 phytochelatin synthase [Micromonospora terminaliae]